MKRLGFLLTTLLMLVLFAVSASALDATGKCGDNVNWNFDSAKGELVISGSGAMEDYDFEGNYSPFMYESNITSIVIKNGVTSIGDYAFTFCRGVTSVTVPDSIKSIGICAFANCVNLKAYEIGKNVTSIGAMAFDNCNDLTKITIPDKVSSIGEYAFQNCSGLTEVKVGNGVTSLYYAFTGCSSLKKVTLGSGLEIIGYYTFSNCDNLQSITIPDSVTNIGNSAFKGCELLKEIKIPAKVENIEESVFYGCNNLERITVDSKNTNYISDDVGALYTKNKAELIQYPAGKADTTYIMYDTVESINDYAFAGSKNLTGIIIPDGVTYIGPYAFLECTALTYVNIPGSVISIGDSAFSYCESLTEISIPEGVTALGNYIFSYCKGLKKITIPVSVTSIGDAAFVGCDKFKDVNYKGTEEQWKKIRLGLYNNTLQLANVNYNSVEDTSHTHVYASAVTKAATCKEEGIMTYTCACGNRFTESIEKTGHNITDEIIKADFDSDGMRFKKCSNCGSVSDEKVIYKVETYKVITDKYNYDGKEKTPGVYVDDVMGTTLKEGTDYQIEYESNRIKPGKYNVKITLMGDYEGEETIKFSILPGKTSKISASQGTDYVKLSWSKVTGATGYRVYQYNSKTGKYDSIKTLTETSYTVKKLKAGTSYKFAVKAYTKDDGETIWASASKTFKTATKPATPTVKATAGTGKATISWDKVAGATGYVIYMQDEFGDYNKLASTTKTSYTKKSLKKGKTYYFRVRAYKTVDGTNIYGGYKTVKVKVK